ncbi:hypothetical protein Tco_0519769 [Tanacetum coccineum]
MSISLSLRFLLFCMFCGDEMISYHFLPLVDRMEEVPEADMPPRKRLCLTSLAPREVRYGITNTWDDLVDAIQEGAPSTLEGDNATVTKLAETYERDTQNLYAHLEDAHDSRAHL